MSGILIPSSIAERVANFGERARELKHESFKEAATRIEFIDPLLVALGWDVNNSSGSPEAFKDVVVEPSQEVDGHKRAPDYAMRLGGERQFFVEAKKPSVWLKQAKEPAFQARRYAWSAHLPVVLLTNFREIAVYDGRVQPKPGDPTTRARVLYMSYDELPARWAELNDLLGRESVLNGSLDRFVANNRVRGGSERIDRVFLRDLESARQELLTHIADRNPTLTDTELLRSVQLTLDRMIFLRFCEDRAMEQFGALRAAVHSTTPLASLEAVYRHADARYNSGLFHFELEPGRSSPDALTLGLTIDDEVLRRVVDRFYPPESPYAFSVMPVEVLGRAYETFLSWRITRQGGQVRLEQKPEVRKAGGVFYTPEWLARQTVALAIEPLLEGKSVDDMVRNPIRVLDPACGSGSFLVASYRYLLDWYLSRMTLEPADYLPQPRSRRQGRLRRNSKGELALTAAERKRILQSHIFGVDIDEQAVEVAKLSLLLTFMEAEEPADAAVALTGFIDRILPDIDANVMGGNSLVGPDMLSDVELNSPRTPEIASVNPFDWRTFGFQFDAIVGNPPWLMAGYEMSGRQLAYLKSKYDSYEGKADLYYLFIERSMELVSAAGRIGLVVPNKMWSTKSAAAIRGRLAASQWVERIVDFQIAQVFEGATNYSQILVLARPAADRTEISYTRASPKLTATESWTLESSDLGKAPWNLSSPLTQSIFSRMRDGATALGDLVDGFGNGVQTGLDPVLILSKERAIELKLEPQYLRPLVRGRNIRDGVVSPSSEVVVFPYSETATTYEVLGPAALSSAPWLEAYLLENEVKLRARKWFNKTAEQLTGQWWGLMYLDAPASFNGHHLVVPSLAGSSSFALAGTELFPTGTAGVTGVRLPDGFDHRPLLALLNSPLISAYALGHSPSYQGGFHKFSAPYIREIPVKLGSSADGAERSRLAALWDARAATTDEASKALVDARISDIVLELYGVSDAELAAVQREVSTLAEDALA